MKKDKEDMISPLAPSAFPFLKPINGVELAAIAANLHYKDRLDLLLISFPVGAKTAGLFTQNQIKAAPVKWCIDKLRTNASEIRGLVVNAGNANAFSGARGVSAANRVAALAAEHLSCSPDQILMASTGVIGKVLTATPFIKPMARLAAGLSNSLWRDACRSIMTTDTFPKAATIDTEIDGTPITINGICKGSGMIAPNMATMLGFVFTNANISADCLQSIMADVNAESFNAITVDGDQSTNDTVLAFATGQADHAEITDPQDKRLTAFKEALAAVMQDLAVQIVRDGEGATRLVKIQVTNAETKWDAAAVARSIAISPLVKTAIAGGDANWGRILMAAGNAGVELKEKALELTIGDQLVASGGSVQRAYSEAEATAHLNSGEVSIVLNLAAGTEQATAWTCDMTHGYISINADYRS